MVPSKYSSIATDVNKKDTLFPEILPPPPPLPPGIATDRKKEEKCHIYRRTAVLHV